ncbi:uncharacterized protein LOC133633617 isoform X2 [Entelurus aequoreus]|uniref:uncharacterized protein LOC133633617 isoform X2 n=1 Tax=Entelurus aequoreus TaxID=161455 RepID=UPI002B1DB0D5|nr:uncharacterized protein LOC133633617 isoform X2 [Entelurus aequoreus]
MAAQYKVDSLPVLFHPILPLNEWAFRPRPLPCHNSFSIPPGPPKQMRLMTTTDLTTFVRCVIYTECALLLSESENPTESSVLQASVQQSNDDVCAVVFGVSAGILHHEPSLCFWDQRRQDFLLRTQRIERHS